MGSFFRSRLRSFRYAFAGWWYVLRTQRNAWIHALISGLVIITSIWLRISPQDWALIFIATAIVWTAEFFNTAVEAIVDLVSPNHAKLAKIGKDVSAAAVLIAALNAVLVGMMVLGPPIWDKISSLLNSL